MIFPLEKRLYLALNPGWRPVQELYDDVRTPPFRKIPLWSRLIRNFSIDVIYQKLEELAKRGHVRTRVVTEDKIMHSEYRITKSGIGHKAKWARF